MWAALENAGLRATLPIPLSHGDRVNDIFIDGQTSQGRHTLRLRGRRHSKFFQLKQFYSLNLDAFLRWQNEARFIGVAPQPGFAWPCEEWRGGLVLPVPAGRRLDLWLAQEDRGMDARLAVAADVASALARLHAGGVEHRRLSPMAVFVDGDDQDVSIDIAEFGFARSDEWDDLWTDSLLADTQDCCASPERLAGWPADRTEDAYGFGALMHQLLAGRPAFGPLGRNLRRLWPQRIGPRSLSTACGAPLEACEVADACLARDPAHRPGMAEIAAVLAAHGGPPLTAGRAPAVHIPELNASENDKAKIMVFIKDDARALRLFDAALDTARTRPSMFLFVGIIPGNLPSGHAERFTGSLYRKMAEGLLRCRRAGLPWSLRMLHHPDPAKAARHLIRTYAPDRIYLGETEAGQGGRLPRRSFAAGLGPLGQRAESFY